MEVTERFHVYSEPSGPHNMREPEFIASENKANPLRWIDPHGHEAWAGSGPEPMGLREAYEALFGAAIDAYNAKQKRKDRRKTVDGYMQEVREDTRGRKNKAIADANARAEARGKPEAIRKEKGKHEAYEVVLSLGNVKNRIPENVAEKIYRRYIEDWPKRNPNFFLYRADYHDGEWFRAKNGHDITGIGGPPGRWSKGVPHSHLSFIPFADGCFKQGLSRQNSVGKALEAMGFDSWESWQEQERDYIAGLAAEYGYTVVRVPEEDAHETAFSAEEYQELADAKADVEEERSANAVRADELERQEAELKEKEAGLNDKSFELERRELYTKVRERLAASKEAELESRERAVAKKEAEAERRLQAARDKEAKAADDMEKAGKLVAGATDVVRKLRGLEGEMDEQQRKRLKLEMARGRRIRDAASPLGTEVRGKRDDGTGPKGPGE